MASLDRMLFGHSAAGSPQSPPSTQGRSTATRSGSGAKCVIMRLPLLNRRIAARQSAYRAPKPVKREWYLIPHSIDEQAMAKGSFALGGSARGGSRGQGQGHRSAA